MLGDAVSSRVTWGVILGLVIGKPLGITLFTWLAVRSKIAEMPRGVTMMHIAGVGAVAGIGFTVALFIGGLAFEIPSNSDQATIGILVASFLATVFGWALLRLSPAPEAVVGDPGHAGSSTGPPAHHEVPTA